MSGNSAQTQSANILHSVESVCSTCLKPVRAQIVEDGSGIWLLKTCDEHGEERVLESRTKEFYHVTRPVNAQAAKALPKSLRVVSSEPTGPTCVAMLEITDSCNLECPLCFAASGPAGGYLMSIAEFESRIAQLLANRGTIDILMISGGEPTVHPDLPEMLGLAVANPQIKHILLNTNGVRLAKDLELRRHLLSAYDKLELYLQFDSLDMRNVLELRGAENVLSAKLSALEWLREAKIATTFAVTLTRSLTPQKLGELLRFALEQPQLRGVTFQPAFASGRHLPHFEPDNRLTTPEVVSLICDACPEIFTRESFTNLPCSHPNCAIVSYFLRSGKALWPLSSQGEPDERLKNRIRFTLDDISHCGCETTDLGQFIGDTELSPENSFRIVVKPFMDRYNLNRDRSSQCCTHVVGPGAKIMSFCEYNIFRDRLGWNLNAGSS